MNSAFWPEFHQVAIYADDHDAAVNMLTHMGYTDWFHDEAKLLGTMGDDRIVSIKARMSFNYQMLGGKELEVVTYEGDSHHHRAGRTGGAPFLSHMSVHVESALRSGRMWADELSVDIVHSFDTFDHVNPLIAGRKRFRECIIGTRDTLGFDVKFIERLHRGPWNLGGNDA